MKKRTVVLLTALLLAGVTAAYTAFAAPDIAEARIDASARADAAPIPFEEIAKNNETAFSAATHTIEEMIQAGDIDGLIAVGYDVTTLPGYVVAEKADEEASQIRIPTDAERIYPVDNTHTIEEMIAAGDIDGLIGRGYDVTTLPGYEG